MRGLQQAVENGSIRQQWLQTSTDLLQELRLGIQVCGRQSKEPLSLFLPEPGMKPGSSGDLVVGQGEMEEVDEGRIGPEIYLAARAGIQNAQFI